MKIKDKTIIISLKGNESNVYFVKYYQKDNKEEYILSSDENIIIIWDIQKYYNQKYRIKSNNGFVYLHYFYLISLTSIIFYFHAINQIIFLNYIFLMKKLPL